MSIENKEFKPKIVAFCCNWCSYAGADLAGGAQRGGKAQDGHRCHHTQSPACKAAVQPGLWRTWRGEGLGCKKELDF